jgi:hypothetical protein
VSGRPVGAQPVGYDAPMSEPTSENESGTSNDTPEQGLVSDEQLPDDLQPEKNPMARPPDDDPDDDPDGAQGAGGPMPGGAADADQPG